MEQTVAATGLQIRGHIYIPLGASQYGDGFVLGAVDSGAIPRLAMMHGIVGWGPRGDRKDGNPTLVRPYFGCSRHFPSKAGQVDSYGMTDNSASTTTGPEANRAIEDHNERLPTKRRRTAVACTICRIRKSRVCS